MLEADRLQQIGHVGACLKFGHGGKGALQLASGRLIPYTDLSATVVIRPRWDHETAHTGEACGAVNAIGSRHDRTHSSTIW